ncbi:solute carrier family 46 member 3-like [Paramacrobiotus metropolitanus]|uniref:solute carrier family 46 member 3-like n=1 Tax=Paramacrobiotus metropolitanus TaxID=2943436 RepID=UPI00244619B8|nr:solute carrier family 46 member 3-like [Paramacrobiotus metropolitanus]
MDNVDRVRNDLASFNLNDEIAGPSDSPLRLAESAAAVTHHPEVLSPYNPGDQTDVAPVFSRPFPIEGAEQIIVEPVSVPLAAADDDNSTEGSSLIPQISPQSALNPDVDDESIFTSAPSAVAVTRLPPCYASLKLAPVALFFGLAVGIAGPIVTELVKLRVCEKEYAFQNDTCQNLNDGHHRKENDLVVSTAAHYSFLLSLTASLPSILFAVFTGSWSDHFGRKLPMMIPFCGMVLSGILLIVFAYVPTHPLVLLVFPFVSASLGGWIIASAAIYSYLGDYSSPATLAIDIAVFDGILNLASNIGSIVGGVLYGQYGFPYPMILYSGLLTLIIVYMGIAVSDRRVLVREFNRHSFARLFTTKNVKENYEMLTKERIGRTKRHIWLLLFSAVIGLICAVGTGAIQQLFFETAPLNWSTKQYTIFSAMTGIVTGLVVMATVPLLKQFFHFADTTVGIVGITSAIFALIALSATTKIFMAVAYAAIGALSSLQFVSLRSLLTNLVDENERGKMMSVIASFQAVFPLLGTLIFTSVFSASVSWWSGFAFALAAMIMLSALAAYCYIDVDRRQAVYGPESNLRQRKSN